MQLLRKQKEGKIRLRRSLQQIAETIACCADKGRLSGPSEDEKL